MIKDCLVTFDVISDFDVDRYKASEIFSIFKKKFIHVDGRRTIKMSNEIKYMYLTQKLKFIITDQGLRKTLEDIDYGNVFALYSWSNNLDLFTESILSGESYSNYLLKYRKNELDRLLLNLDTIIHKLDTEYNTYTSFAEKCKDTYSTLATFINSSDNSNSSVSDWL